MNRIRPDDASAVTRRIIGVSLGWLGISMVSDGVPALLLPHQLLSSGENAAASLGMITLIAIAVAAAVQPLAGRWSDSVGRWPVIAAGVALALGGLILLLVGGSVALPGAVVALIGVSVAQAGHQALLPELVAQRWRGRASGAKSALDVSGAILGFVLLGVLLGGNATLPAVLLLGAVLAVPFLLAYLLLRTPPPLQTPAAFQTPGQSIGSASGLVGLVVARFLFLLGIYAVGRFLLLFIADRLRLDADAAAEQAGMALALLAAITVAGSAPAGWLADRFGRRWLMGTGGAFAAAGIALLPIAGSMTVVVIFGTLMALGTAAFNAGSWAALADLTARPGAGRLLALANFGTAGAAALAGAFGLIIDAGNRAAPAAGYVLAFELAAACALAGGILAWRLVARAAVTSPVYAEVSR